jgi:lipopolysaccharide transport system permease protein
VLRRAPGSTALGLLLLLPLQLALALGLGIAVASLTAMVRDVSALVGPILTIWFLGTPVIYPQQLVPGALKDLINANPLTPLVEGYRALILEHRFPPTGDWLYLLGIALFALLAGHWIYGQTRGVIIDRV